MSLVRIFLEQTKCRDPTFRNFRENETPQKKETLSKFFLANETIILVRITYTSESTCLRTCLTLNYFVISENSALTTLI